MCLYNVDDESSALIILSIDCEEQSRLLGSRGQEVNKEGHGEAEAHFQAQLRDWSKRMWLRKSDGT